MESRQWAVGCWPLRDSNELEQTDDGVLAVRSAPGAVPVTIDPDGIIDEVLECYTLALAREAVLRADIEHLQEALGLCTDYIAEYAERTPYTDVEKRCLALLKDVRELTRITNT